MFVNDFHSRFMGRLVQLHGIEHTFRHPTQTRFEVPFYDYTGVVTFADCPPAYFESRGIDPTHLPPGHGRHCKRAELNIDGEYIAAQYDFDEVLKGFVAAWVPGAGWDDISDTLKVKLTILMNEFWTGEALA